ncbi:NAD(P)H-hydrate dehydratase [Salinispira pacifica]
MKLVTTETMARIDRDAQERYGIDGIVLMEGAALRCAEILEALVTGALSPEALPGFSHFFAGPAARREPQEPAGSAAPSPTPADKPTSRAAAERPVVFVAGKGNNGGDALAMARLAAVRGLFPVSVVLAFDAPGGLAGKQLGMLRQMGVPVMLYGDDPKRAAELFESATWIVDGLFGTGIRGALRSPADEIASAVNGARRPVFAVDTPSGIGDSFERGFPAVEAAVTATVGLPKQCLFLPSARPYCGRIVAVPISFPPQLFEDDAIRGAILEPAELGTLLPSIGPATYKNRRGHLAAFAGAPGTVGAAVLSATAAARSRAGLVSLYVEQSAYEPAAASCTSVMAHPWRPEQDRAEELVPDRYTALLVGPGWGQDTNRARWLKGLVASGLPGVLDADGLNVLSAMSSEERSSLRFDGRWVLTPHPGEFARLRKMSAGDVLKDPVAAALAAAEELNAVVVLKGHVTTIAAPTGEWWLVDGMNPAMATGGTGDVLCGIIGGLLASGMNAAEAAASGVLLHQETGRATFDETGWFISEDLLPRISRVLARYQKQG